MAIKISIEATSKPKGNKRGFTLVELAVVITALAFLATIAIVSFAGITNNTRKTQAIANITSCKTAATAITDTTIGALSDADFSAAFFDMLSETPTLIHNVAPADSFDTALIKQGYTICTENGSAVAAAPSFENPITFVIWYGGEDYYGIWNSQTGETTAEKMP